MSEIKSTINIEFSINEDGKITDVTIHNKASQRDMLVAAMYLLEDAIRADKATKDCPNPTAEFVSAATDALCLLTGAKK